MAPPIWAPTHSGIIHPIAGRFMVPGSVGPRRFRYQQLIAPTIIRAPWPLFQPRGFVPSRSRHCRAAIPLPRRRPGRVVKKLSFEGGAGTAAANPDQEQGSKTLINIHSIKTDRLPGKSQFCCGCATLKQN
jgi:hypothetical protein